MPVMGTSPLTLGAMRLDRTGGVNQATALIRSAIELGVTTFHASQEYETWPLFVAAWREASPDPDKVKLIAKIGVPHFGQDRFEVASFEAKVDAYRTALNLDRVAIVQWLLRHDLQDELGRQAIFDRDADLISETVWRLRREGRIDGLVSFPYTRSIAKRALAAEWCDGLALYCNALELDLVDLMDDAETRGKAVVTIRPFAAGRIFTQTSMTAREAIALPLAHPAVVTTVASVSRIDRLREASAAAQAAPKGMADWTAALIAARNATHV
jgi:aryl-alcohol dehydrogenase-like predicted oxidoreductase